MRAMFAYMLTIWLWGVFCFCYFVNELQMNPEMSVWWFCGAALLFILLSAFLMQAIKDYYPY